MQEDDNSNVLVTQLTIPSVHVALFTCETKLRNLVSLFNLNPDVATVVSEQYTEEDHLVRYFLTFLLDY